MSSFYLGSRVSWGGVNSSSGVSPTNLASTDAILTTPSELKIARAQEKILNAMKVSKLRKLNKLSIGNCTCMREDFECDEGGL